MSRRLLRLLTSPTSTFILDCYVQYQPRRRCLLRLLLLDFDLLFFFVLLGFASSLSIAEDELDMAPSSLLSLESLEEELLEDEEELDEDDD